MAEQLSTSSLSKAQKAALIFLLLEEKGAASVLGQMSDREIKKIGKTMLSMGEIPVGEMTVILSEFYGMMGIREPDQFSGQRLFEKMIDKTLSPDRRGKILNVRDVRGGLGSSENPFEDLFSERTPEQVYKLIKDEHPQTIAVTLTLVKPHLSRELIALFDATTQPDLLYRMSLLSKIPSDIVGLMADDFHERMTVKGAAAVEETAEKKAVEVPGVDVVLKYLKTQDWMKAEEIIVEIEKDSADIAQVLRKRFFTLEDLLRSDNNGIRNLLRNVETATLAVVLKGKPPQIQDIFFQNMSTRAATILKEDIEIMPEQKPEDVEAGIDKLLGEARRLIGEGQMILAPLAED